MATRGRPRLQARLKKWKGEWHVFYTDRSDGMPVTKRVLCSAHGATNADDRRELRSEYRRLEREQEAEEEKFGSLGYGSSLISALNKFKKFVDEQAELREKSSAARVGVAEETQKGYLDTLKRFKAWLRDNGHEKIKTGQIQAQHLREFFDHLASEKSRHGRRKVQRGPHTLNKHKRQLRAAFLQLAGLRPPLFPDVDQLRTAFKPFKTDGVQPVSFTPSQLTAFLGEALSYESVKYVAVKRKVRNTDEVQHYDQRLNDGNKPLAKISRLFLILALTGCRRGEALRLKFSDVDLDKGVITFRAQKTRTRWVPLIDVSSEIGPEFLRLLKKWKLEGNSYIVSGRDGGEPGFPQGTWNKIARSIGLRRMGPQRLRQNFTSYAAALGVPASIAALWQGHSVAVAEKFYRTIVMSRVKSDDFETSMGLKHIITKMIKGEESEVVALHRKKSAPPAAVA